MPSNCISQLNIDGTIRPIKDRTNFVGTLAEWDALTDSEKEQYDTYDITDDYTEPTYVTANDFVVNGSTLYFPSTNS